jgi:neutral ceramidase
MLKCGRAVADITPPVGLYLTGFGGRTGPAKGVHDELYARAAVLSDDENEFAIVSLDLCGLDPDVIKSIREGAEEKIGIAAENITLCSSHTHSGPATYTLRGIEYRDEFYIGGIEGSIVGAIHEASKNMRESTVRFGEGRSDVGINRRERAPSGEIILGRNPLGVMDPTVSVIAIESGDSSTVLYNYASHPIVLGPANLLYSADFPGYAAKTIEGSMKGAVAMFIQGCAGDINSTVGAGTFDDSERLGGSLGAEVLRAVGRSEVETDPRLESAAKKVRLTLELPSDEEIGRSRERYRSNLMAAEENDNQSWIDYWSSFSKWADAAADLARMGERRPVHEVEIQALRVGGTALVMIPGEPLTEMALAIRARSKFRHTIVAGYVNDSSIGYIPTPQAFAEGGYEVTAYRETTVASLTPACYHEVLEAAVQLCDEVHSR